MVVVVFPLFGLSQLSEQEKSTLRVELGGLINELRLSKGLQPLVFNDTLRAAAEFHSQYMAKSDNLSHSQPKSKYKTPTKRVVYKGGKVFVTVGENVLYSTQQKFPLNKKEVSALALEMFNSWKNSPGHYANMTDPKYVYGDLGFSINTKKQNVFATHVFGTKGHLVNGQISKNQFGLVPAAEDCDKEFKQFSNLVLNMGNGLSLDGDEVVLYYHNISYFEKIFSNDNDGMAIDLISKDQFNCGGPNMLDLSPVHDGILLKPVYRNEMFKNNRAESNYRVITKVGDIPEGLNGDDYSLSVILIKDGKSCKYMYPAQHPSKDYDLRPFDPYLNNDSKIEFVLDGVIASQELRYDFRTNKKKAVKLPEIDRSFSDIHSIQINSFSSVEGDSTHNSSLHNARASFIQNHLMDELKVSAEKISKNASENWSLMDFQLNYFERDELSLLSHDSLKKVLKVRDTSLPWDSLLFAQRKAEAIINYFGEFEEDGVEDLSLFNLRTAVAMNNVELANKALYVMYQNDEYNPHVLFESQIMDFMNTHPETVANYSANLSRYYNLDLYKVTNFIYAWMYREDELNDKTRANLLHLYTLVGLELLDRWDVSAKRLSNVIHPLKIEDFTPDNLNDELLLNLQLTYIQYFGQVNDGTNINRAFRFIAEYFKENNLKPKDDVDLALFYNSWSMYRMTVDHLSAKFKQNKLNEDGLFLLAKTMNFTNYKDVSGIYVDVQKKAIESNSERWCDWVDYDFQVMRNTEVKRMFCETCK